MARNYNELLDSLVPRLTAAQLAAQGADDPFFRSHLSELINRGVRLEAETVALQNSHSVASSALLEQSGYHAISKWTPFKCFNPIYAVKVIASYGGSLQSLIWTFWQLETKSPEVQFIERLLNRIACYRRFEVYARYGDYLATRLGALRKQWQEDDVDPDQYWSALAQRLDDETVAKDLKEAIDELNIQSVKLNRRAGVELSQNDRKWTVEEATFMAREYGKRNTLMHANLSYHVKVHDWAKFGELCANDLRTLEGAFHEDAHLWQQVIEGFRDRYVEPDPDKGGWRARKIIAKAVTQGLGDLNALNEVAAYSDLVSDEEQENIVGNIKQRRDEAAAGLDLARSSVEIEREAHQAKLESRSDVKDALGTLAMGSEASLQSLVHGLNVERKALRTALGSEKQRGEQLALERSDHALRQVERTHVAFREREAFALLLTMEQDNADLKVSVEREKRRADELQREVNAQVSREAKVARKLAGGSDEDVSSGEDQNLDGFFGAGTSD